MLLCLAAKICPSTHLRIYFFLNRETLSKSFKNSYPSLSDFNYLKTYMNMTHHIYGLRTHAFLFGNMKFNHSVI